MPHRAWSESFLQPVFLGCKNAEEAGGKGNLEVRTTAVKNSHVRRTWSKSFKIPVSGDFVM
jgi:hypothetical protein